MPVSVLFCEGGEKSPDIRVLSSLLAGICVVRRFGGKYGMGDRVKITREVSQATVVAAIRDRDLDNDAVAPTQSPRDWRVEGGKLWLGWYWERVEIENYLVDPLIVLRALANRNLDENAYRAALDTAANRLCCYTAARAALASCRPRFTPLSCSWGTKRGLDDHPFPDSLGRTACRAGIRQVIAAYKATQIVPSKTPLQEFSTLLPACLPGGVRHTHYLTFFSGKDLLIAMQPSLPGFGFASARMFREAVLKGIEETTEDPWLWLPEWMALRNLVGSLDSNQGP